MIIEIQHETRIEYASEVYEGFSEVRMEPVSDAAQSCRSFHLRTVPKVEHHRYIDGFGNRVHHFGILHMHDQINVISACVVDTHVQPVPLQQSAITFPIAEKILPIDTFAYLLFDGPVTKTPLLDPLLEKLRPGPGERLVDWVKKVSTFIKKNFTYAPDVTQASSPIIDVLRERKGVCQDFAHLMIAILRSNNIPARYVSGYIHRPGRESQSHAWVEVYIPGLDWIAIDPTNDCLIDDHFVKVAIGRSFIDVPPNKGIYRGDASQNISVRVETRTLERLPPLTWQDQLPPLQVPLRRVIDRKNPGLDEVLLVQQQQQQQQ